MHKHCQSTDLVVFSHLRWDFVFQRPQHLMMRYANHRRVYFFEEPFFTDSETPRLEFSLKAEGVAVVVPFLPHNLSPAKQNFLLKELVDQLIAGEEMEEYSVWYYTPMALPFSRHLTPKAILFDCMDELSKFHGAPVVLRDLEAELLQKADVVYTGGHALFEEKKDSHHNIHPFPSSIDFSHFSQGRKPTEDPADQAHIPHPRVGFFGVIDERMDIELVRELAALRPDYQFVIIGPVVKIDPATLPQAANIHYLGKKEYSELPNYIANWDCAFMPFALNDATRFISPTKTPEFLAAGKPVVSTPIRDVVSPYGRKNLVHIARDASQFIDAIDLAMKERQNSREWFSRVDAFLSTTSWDITWERMAKLEKEVYQRKLQLEQMPEFDLVQTAASLSVTGSM